VEVIILPSAGEVAQLAARIIAGLVRRKPAAVLGLATGATPRPVYAELVRRHREEGLSFAGVTTFNLDEFVGLAPDHRASYHHYMFEALFAHVDLPVAARHLPDGMAPPDEIPAACDRYEAAIRAAGGIDLQVLGLGADGHIGFNEPSSSLASRTRVKTLTEATRAAQRTAAPGPAGAGPGGDGGAGTRELPRHVITMGVATILEARRCLLLATGARKAGAVARTVEGPVAAMVPASALQLHPRATVIVDEAAAADLTLAEYYRGVYRDKPAWQREG
jgi:glucosamine-6-phosphate deaminase